MSGILLGGPKAWKVRAVGDLVLAYHWYNDEPTMFIYPRYRRLRLTKATPWGLPLTAAHELVNAGTKGHGVNSAELLAKSERCAELMGFQNDRQAVFAIADLILSGLTDLIHMPPTPEAFLREEAPVGGTMQLVVDGKTVLEKDV
jgi:hypothetical protein